MTAKHVTAALLAACAALLPALAWSNSTTTNLGLNKPGVGSDADAWGGYLNTNADTLDALFTTGPVLLLAKGGTGASTAAGARTALGLGSIATQAASAVAITGGAIDGTIIGGSTKAAGSFTALTATGNTALGDGNTDTTTITGHLAGAGTVVTLDTCGGSPVIASGSSDIRGTITTGTAAGTACNVDFSAALASVPHCVVTTYSASVFAAISGVNTTQLAIAFSGSYASQKFSYICVL